MSALRIDVSDLLAHAGARRSVALTVPVEELAVSTVHVDEPLELDLVLERVAEGIVVRGTIRAHWEGECAVCLRELAADVDVSVSDLFERHPVDGETYLLDGHQIDLEQLVRDSVLLDLPLVPTCESLGLAACEPHVELLGNDPDAETGDAPADPRWSALSELEL
jgi:DUF177 domain-containing protein